MNDLIQLKKDAEESLKKPFYSATWLYNNYFSQYTTSVFLEKEEDPRTNAYMAIHYLCLAVDDGYLIFGRSQGEYKDIMESISIVVTDSFKNGLNAKYPTTDIWRKSERFGK